MLVYLGSPLTDEAIPASIDAVKSKVERLTHRLNVLPKHQALYLLKNCLGSVKLLYTLRTSRAYRFPDSLKAFDEIVRLGLSSICNVDVSGPMWSQATLPVAAGGLGTRRAEELSLPAFLASVHSVRSLVSEIIPFDLAGYLDSTPETWANASRSPPPDQELLWMQKAWDIPLVQRRSEEVLHALSQDPHNQARLLAVSSKESGAWLRALPVASLGNLLDDNSLRISVALRLGAVVSRPHSCVCSSVADARGYHGLSCRLSAGRHSRHAGINAIIKRALGTAEFPAQLEPAGLARSDGKRPDGVTLSPWSKGKCLCWDATVVCTMALSHFPASLSKAGAAASSAELRKSEKYRTLSNNFEFVPLGFETMGPWGPEAIRLIRDIGVRIKAITGEARAVDYLRQRISIEIQRGNAASVLGTFASSENLDDLFCSTRHCKKGWQLQWSPF